MLVRTLAGFACGLFALVSIDGCGNANEETTPSSGAGGGCVDDGASPDGASGSGVGGDCSTGSGLELTSGAGGSVPITCGEPMTASDCQADADCDDSDATTNDACVTVDLGGEFPSGVCVHVPCQGAECPNQAVDPTCSQGNMEVVYPPFVPLGPPAVPETCANGFQLIDAQGAPPYVIETWKPEGSQGLSLELDFATYTAPDGILITGLDANCQPYVLFDSCRLKTADKPWNAYSDGKSRPADEAIRRFALELLPGTRELRFDFSRVTSPMFLEVLGLCDFVVTPAAGVKWFYGVP